MSDMGDYLAGIMRECQKSSDVEYSSDDVMALRPDGVIGPIDPRPDGLREHIQHCSFCRAAIGEAHSEITKLNAQEVRE